LTAPHICGKNHDVISGFSFPVWLSTNEQPEKSNMADFFPFSTNQQKLPILPQDTTMSYTVSYGGADLSLPKRMS